MSIAERAFFLLVALAVLVACLVFIVVALSRPADATASLLISPRIPTPRTPEAAGVEVRIPVPPPGVTESASAPRPRVAHAQKGENRRGVWDRLAACESASRWHLNTGAYDGGLQFLPSTWRAAGGRRYAPYAHQASREQQIAVARRWLARTSWAQWPVCSKRLGLR